MHCKATCVSHRTCQYGDTHYSYTHTQAHAQTQTHTLSFCVVLSFSTQKDRVCVCDTSRSERQSVCLWYIWVFLWLICITNTHSVLLSFSIYTSRTTQKDRVCVCVLSVFLCRPVTLCLSVSRKTGRHRKTECRFVFVRVLVCVYFGACRLIDTHYSCGAIWEWHTCCFTQCRIQSLL